MFAVGRCGHQGGGGATVPDTWGVTWHLLLLLNEMLWATVRMDGGQGPRQDGVDPVCPTAHTSGSSLHCDVS